MPSNGFDPERVKERFNEIMEENQDREWPAESQENLDLLAVEFGMLVNIEELMQSGRQEMTEQEVHFLTSLMTIVYEQGMKQGEENAKQRTLLE